MGKVSKRASSDKTKHPEDDGVSVGSSLELPDFKSKKRKPVRSDNRKDEEYTVPSIGKAVWRLRKKRSQKKPPVRSDIPKRYPCIYTECTKDFSTNFGMCKHVERSHHFVRCGICDKFMSELEFRSHCTSTKKCQNAGFTRWRKDPTQEWDWDLNWKEKVVEKPPVRSDNTPRILCIYYHKGCPSDFASRVGMHKHVRRCHHFLRCGTCDEFMSEFQFPSHRTSNEKCNNANFIRWNKKEGVEADWDLKWSDPVRSDKTKRISCMYAQSKGCQADFKKNRHMYKHVKRFHHYLECNTCNEVMSEHDFSSHRTSNKKCKNATFTRLNEDLQKQEAWDLKWKRNWKKENPVVRSDTNVKIPCLNVGCSSDFSELRSMLDHVSKTHHTIICRSCTNVMSEFEFGVHRSKSLKCRHAILKRWNPLTQSEADWDLNWRRKLHKQRPPEVSTDNTDRYVCIYSDNGCTENYTCKQTMCKHISKFHHVVKCNSCAALVSEFDFSPHQLISSEECKDASFTRWNLDLEQEGDWELNWRDKIIFKDIYSKMRAQKAKKVRSDVMKTRLLQNPFRHRSKKMSLSCEVSECAFTTPYKTRLALHYKTEHNSRNWAVKFDSYNEVNVECTTNGCDFSTNSEVLMSTHTKGHKKAYPFLCELCSHLFKTKDLVMNHLLETHKIYKHRSRLFRHQRFPTKGTEKSKSTCNICGKQVKHLKLHENRSHPPELSESNCPFCTEIIPDPEPLNDNPTMSCEEPSCEFQSCSRSAYRDHAFTHDTMKNAITAWKTSISDVKRRLKCSWGKCKYLSFNKKDLDAHKQLHKQGQTIQCIICQQLLRSNAGVALHASKAHNIKINWKALKVYANETEGIIKLYQCTVSSCCNWTTSIKSLWEIHVIHHVNHTKDRFRCGICKVIFEKENNLCYHFEITHNNTDFLIRKDSDAVMECSDCGLQFEEVIGFITHYEVYHEDNIRLAVDKVMPNYYSEKPDVKKENLIGIMRSYTDL